MTSGATGEARELERYYRQTVDVLDCEALAGDDEF